MLRGRLRKSGQLGHLGQAGVLGYLISTLFRRQTQQFLRHDFHFQHNLRHQTLAYYLQSGGTDGIFVLLGIDMMGIVGFLGAQVGRLAR